MDLVPILVTVVLISTLSTLVLAVLSYRTFRAGETGRPLQPVESPRKVFLVRLGLPEAARPVGRAGPERRTQPAPRAATPN